jgi:hypothetical protein
VSSAEEPGEFGLRRVAGRPVLHRVTRRRDHEQAAVGGQRGLGPRAGQRGREVVPAGQQQDGNPRQLGTRCSWGRGGEGGQCRQVWMKPLPAAVARSNGQT